MGNVNGQAVRRDERAESANVEKVRKVVQEVCAGAGTSVAIEELVLEAGKTGRGVAVTYNGEKPLAYAVWFKLVDRIDAALDPMGIVDWESSELSEEDEEERSAAWTVLAVAGV